MTHATTNRVQNANAAVRRLTGAALLFRVRAKAAAKAFAQFTQALHEGQPLLPAESTFLCQAYFGNVRLDLYGTSHHLRSGIVVDLDNAAVAGTQISLRDSLNGKQWEDLHRQAQIALEEGA
ncbi:hypothetical protein SAMD00023378_3926 [Ralstonia sp. NT80]|uniref:hypothetical protein n=1 Tax=Ralstonia sp. NT80 TaxID=1218247 RepID=UPI00073E1D4A|nr:hypothetical protein [Ralstonia sp. NT80]GAQ30243.1 hypothetical protein SAMD00023378_3926 [Ralstonia sp. NT80]